MKTKTSELTDAALDWAVAISKGIPAEELYIQKWGSRMPPSIYRRCRDADGSLDGSYTTGPDLLFSRKWEAGGPIIEREITKIFRNVGGTWSAMILKDMPIPPEDRGTSLALTQRMQWNAAGATPLIAAMRCFCSFKLGDEVEVPDELL